jgi:Cd2+/Zn2+-exporting ATPase
MTNDKHTENKKPTPPVEDDENEGLNKTEAILTVICALTLVAGWAGGTFGLFPPSVEVALFVVAYLSGGYFGVIEGVKSLRQGEINVDFLMVLAAVGAASIGEWAEGATLLFLFSLSNTLQGYALDRSRQAIRALMDLRPPEALVRRPDGQEVLVPVEELQLGDLVIVKPGERMPIDGKMVAGHTTVDQSPSPARVCRWKRSAAMIFLPGRSTATGPSS